MSRAGFSITEVLICCVVAGFAILPVLTLCSGATRQEALDESVVVAGSLALKGAECVEAELLSAGFRVIERTSPGFYSVTVSAAPVDAAEDLWQVTARVEWTLPADGVSRPPHSSRIRRLISRPEAAFSGGAK